MNESSGGIKVNMDDVRSILEHFSRSTHKVKAGDIKGETFMEKCLTLFAKDYKYSILPNNQGELCAHYPSKVVLLEYEISSGSNANTEYRESLHNMSLLKELIKTSRVARCRSRFAAPVILYQGKHICRSATLAGGAEIYGRTGLEYLFSAPDSVTAEDSASSRSQQGDWPLFNKYRGSDIQLLKTLSVKYICDLMVEKKKVKFGVQITSSEKVDKEKRYSDFCILSVPYPGCEHFKEWRDKGYAGEKTIYDWTQDFNNANLDIPQDPVLDQLPLPWHNYKEWDLIQLTQNYLKLLLHIIQNSQDGCGLLVHCISGWDRTPLFISLLRLSLWADGAIHQSLSATEILYLTLGYDWYLFGHNLLDRLNKGEEILYFCFNFLSHIAGDEYSVNPTPRRRRRSSSSRAPKPDPLAERRQSRRCDSESSMPVDGVLLEEEEYRGSGIHGSSSSISSLGSADTSAVFLGIQEDDSLGNDCPQGASAVAAKTHSPLTVPRSATPDSSRSPSSSSALGLTHAHCPSPFQGGSSPMPVPRTRQPQADGPVSSPVIGSWQIVSSSGSFRALGALDSNSDSSHTASSGRSSSSSNGYSFVPSHMEAPVDSNQTLRQQRLESVRSMFHTAYTSTLTAASRSPSESGAISSLVSQFAEKVGLRSRQAPTAILYTPSKVD